MTDAHATRRWLRPLAPRSPDEGHRAATPLELFFDLVFVVAIAQVAAGLHHGIAEGHAAEAVLNFGLVFFAIWWAWMGFTWFASSYDNDDVGYRLAVLVQLTGALIFAAGVTAAFKNQDYRVVGIGFVVMRLAMVVQRLRAARADPGRRRGAYRHSGSLVVLQTAWIGLVFSPTAWLVPGIIVLGTLEMLAVVWSERASPTPWHPGHIAEGYGLLTIIVLGEAILAASLAVEGIVQAGEVTLRLVPALVGGLLTVFSMWWLYFDDSVHDLLTDLKTAFVWGYGHLLVYGSAAAVGAGLAVAFDETTGHAAIGRAGAGAAVAVPAALYVLTLWFLHERPRGGRAHYASLAATAALVAAPFSPLPVLSVGVVLAALVAFHIVVRTRSAHGAVAGAA